MCRERHAFLPSRLRRLNWAALRGGPFFLRPGSAICAAMSAAPLASSSSPEASIRWSPPALRARPAFASRAHRRLQPAPPDRARGGGAHRRAARRRAARRPAARPQPLRRLGADRRLAVPKDGAGRGHPGHLRAGAQHHLPLALPGLGRGARRPRPLHRRQRARLFGLSRLPARIHRRLRDAWPTSPPRPASRAAASRIHTPLIGDDQGRHRPRGGAARARRGDELVLLRSDAGRAPLRPVRQLPAAREGLRRGRPRRSHPLCGSGPAGLGP